MTDNVALGVRLQVTLGACEPLQGVREVSS